MFRWYTRYKQNASLYHAIQINSFEAVEKSIQNGADVNNTSNNESPLITAIKQKNVKIVECLLNAGAHVRKSMVDEHNNNQTIFSIDYMMNVVNSFWSKETTKSTPLGEAIKYYNLDIIQLLLDADVDANERFDDNIPLIYAIQAKNTVLVDYLIKRGANLNIKGRTNTPLISAVQQGSSALVKALLSHSADVNFVAANGATPLIEAVKKDNLEIVNLLLDHGADVNAGLADQTILSGATDAFFSETSSNSGELEFDFWAEVNSELVFDKTLPETHDQTPLMLAIRNENAELVNRLLKAGANPDPDISTDTPTIVETVPTKKRNNNTPLIQAVKLNNIEIVTLLLKAGADVNRAKAKTPLIAAIDEENLAMIQLLLNNHASPNRAVGKDTPLLRAIDNKNVEVVELLLEKGADSNKKCKDVTPLMLAISKEHVSIVDGLLTAGSDANALSSGQLPLIKAIKKCNILIIDLLLKHSANPKGKNEKGQSALDYLTFKYEFARHLPIYQNMCTLITNANYSLLEKSQLFETSRQLAVMNQGTNIKQFKKAAKECADITWESLENDLRFIEHHADLLPPVTATQLSHAVTRWSNLLDTLKSKDVPLDLQIQLEQVTKANAELVATLKQYQTISSIKNVTNCNNTSNTVISLTSSYCMFPANETVNQEESTTKEQKKKLSYSS